MITTSSQPPPSVLSNDSLFSSVHSNPRHDCPLIRRRWSPVSHCYSQPSPPPTQHRHSTFTPTRSRPPRPATYLTEQGTSQPRLFSSLFIFFFFISTRTPNYYSSKLEHSFWRLASLSTTTTTGNPPLYLLSRTLSTLTCPPLTVTDVKQANVVQYSPVSSFKVNVVRTERPRLVAVGSRAPGPSWPAVVLVVTLNCLASVC